MRNLMSSRVFSLTEKSRDPGSRFLPFPFDKLRVKQKHRCASAKQKNLPKGRFSLRLSAMWDEVGMTMAMGL
jgi:hypothetical protein